MKTPVGRCKDCLHPKDDHRRVFVAEGIGAGQTLIRCSAWVRHHRCKCVTKPKEPTVAENPFPSDDDPTA